MNDGTLWVLDLNIDELLAALVEAVRSNDDFRAGVCRLEIKARVIKASH